MYWAYHALGVRPGSKREEVRRSYRRLLKAYHPDMLNQRCLSEDVKRRELQKFYEIQKAWESLERSYEESELATAAV